MKPSVFAALLAMLAPLPASAAIVRATYTGIVGSGSFDYSGVFGVAGTDLSGFSYRAVTVFDTGRGEIQTPPFAISAIGGDQFGTSNPAISSALTINGVTATLTPDFFGEIYSAHYPAPMFSPLDVQFHGARHVFFDGITQEDDFVQNQITVESGNGLPFGIETSFGYRVQPGDGATGSFQFFHCCDLDGNAVSASGQLIPHTLLVGVPEPDSWVLLIAGFGLTGASLRRRRCLAA